MDLKQLQCFIAVATELHFGRAAQSIHMLPSAMSRNIQLLEDELCAVLFHRTTRAVTLTADGLTLFRQARPLLASAAAIEAYFREKHQVKSERPFRIGVIDSAAAGLVPQFLRDMAADKPAIGIRLYEDKTIRLLPKLLTGAIDFAFIRPPLQPDPRLEILPLLNESAVVAVYDRHRFARRRALTVSDLTQERLILPDRRSRPHSHDLTMHLFESAGLVPQIAHVANEKQTIVSLVAKHLGIAIVPRWTSNLAVRGVRYITLKQQSASQHECLPLAAAWMRGTTDPLRDRILKIIKRNLKKYSARA